MTATSNEKELVILGAGISGVSCAHSFKGKYRIYEAQPHLGGHAYSHEMDGYHFDEGAHICHSKDMNFLEATTALDTHKVHNIQECKVRSLWKNNWHKYPVQNNLGELSSEDRAKAMTGFILAQSKPEILQNAKNYEEWCLGQYGEFLTREFYEVYTRKYWRTEMKDLSTDWLGGRLLPSQIENVVNGAFGLKVVQQAAFSQFRYPKQGGFHSLLEPMYKKVNSNVELNRTLYKVDLKKRSLHFKETDQCIYFDRVVNTIPLDIFVECLEDQAPQSVQQAAKKLRYTSLLCVNFTLKHPPKINLDHWFYIYDPKIPPSRCSLVHQLQGQGASSKNPAAVQAEIFFRKDEIFDKNHIIEKTISKLSNILGFDWQKDISEVGSTFCKRSYIVSDHELKAASQHILSWLEENSIYPLGLLGRWKYIWSDEAYRQGIELGKKLSAQ